MTCSEQVVEMHVAQTEEKQARSGCAEQPAA
jgi:hypothetical protein